MGYTTVDEEKHAKLCLLDKPVEACLAGRAPYSEDDPQRAAKKSFDLAVATMVERKKFRAAIAQDDAGGEAESQAEAVEKQ